MGKNQSTPDKHLLTDSIKISPYGRTDNKRVDILYLVFCAWLFVLMCRPQDIWLFLSPLHPALLMSVFVFILLIFRIHGLGKKPSFQGGQNKLFAALVVVIVLSIPLALYRRLSFEYVTTSYSIVILFYYLFYNIVDSIYRLRTIILLGCIGNGIYLAYSVATGTMIEGRLFFGDMFDANDLAFYALSFLPLNLIFISRDNSKLIRITCLGFFIVGMLLILLTGSRGGMLAFAAVMALALFTKSHVIKRPLKVIFVSLFVILFSVAPANIERFKTIFSLEDDYNVQYETGRLAIWKAGLRIMLANPLTGVGVLNFGEAIGTDRQKRGAITMKWQAPHNMVVQIGTETGVIGMTLFLLMSLNVFRIMTRAHKRSNSKEVAKIAEMGRLGFLGLFVSGMFLSQAYSIYWAFYVAFSAIINQMLIQEEKATN